MNLLPKPEEEILKKGFKNRSIIVANIFLALAFLIGSILLFPSYFLTKGRFKMLTSLNSSVPTEDQEVINTTLGIPEEINLKMQFLDTYLKNRYAAESLAKIISYLPSGVRLNSISFIREDKEPTRGVSISISGIAFSRDALVEFETVLEKSEYFDEVDVPVSSLAKEKNLPFSMNIIIKSEK